MAAIDSFNDYERHFYEVMKARGYKHSLIRDTYTTELKGVRLTHPDGTFRFEVEGFTFNIQTPKTESRSWGGRKKEITKWYSLRNFFTQEEHEAMQDARIVPDLDDIQFAARIETTIKANDDEVAMREIRMARRQALREAAPAMWRALSLITSDKIDREFLEDADPKALKQCLEALEEAGEQDTQDLSVARSGLSGY